MRVLEYLFSFQPLWYFILALFITWLMRRRSPFVCYLLWVLVLIKFILPFGLYERAINLNFIHSSFMQFETVSEGDSSSVSFPPIEQTGIGDSIAQKSQVDSKKGKLTSQGKDRIEPAPVTRWDHLVQIFLYFWISISITVLLYKSFLFFRFRKMVRSWSVLKDGYVRDHFLHCVTLAGLKNIPTLRVSPKESIIPFTIGLRVKNQSVVIPDSLIEDKNIRKLQIVFCHELNHIKKKDQHVNFIRFVGLILFHCHPLRILADRFVEAYQEITTDLRTIKILGLTKKEYVNTLLASFMEIDKSRYLKQMSLPFLEGEFSFVKRLFYIKKYNPQQSRFSQVCAQTLFLAFLAVSLLNISIYAFNPSVLQLILDSKNGLHSFPSPIQTYPSILHESGASLKVHEGYLWVIEPRYGVYVYELIRSERPRLVSQYILEKTGPENTQETIKDFTFYGKYLYLAIADINLIPSEKNRIEILTIGVDLSMTYAGKITCKYPTLVEVYHQSLWAGGMGEEISDGIVTIYDLSNPISPEIVDEDHFDFIPTNMELLENPESMLVLVYNEILFYNDSQSLDSSAILNIGQTPGYIQQIDSNHIVIWALQNRIFPSPSITQSMILLSRGVDREFYVSCTAELQLLDQQNVVLSVENPINVGHLLVSPFPNQGVGLFEVDQNVFRLHSYISQKYNYAIRHEDQVLFLYPETYVFSLEDLQNGPSPILAWKHY